VFRKPDGESDHSAATGTSNLKMLQQCKLELAKKESLVAKMSDELKELYDKLKACDEVHAAEMKVLRLEFDQKLESKDKAAAEKDALIKDVRLRAEKAEANAKKDDGFSLSKKEMDDIKAAAEKLAKDIEQKDKVIEEMRAELEQYIKDNEEKAREIESLKLDIETIQVEKSILEEEKAIVENEMKQQEEDRLRAMEESMTDDELKLQNEKLRIALRKLGNDIEVERARWEQTQRELQDQVDRIPELEEKLADIDILLAAVEERDEEIESMKQAVEEAAELQQMIEEITEEVVEKDEIIEELEAKTAELEEVQAFQEEINANQEKFEAELQEELNRKDIKIQQLEDDIQILEEAILEQDDRETKHKERMNELNKENELLKQQLDSAYDEKTKNKMGELIDKQRKLQIQLKELSRKEIGGSLAEINVGISNTLANLYHSFIPENLLNEGYISEFSKVRLVIYVKHKSYLLYTELCKKKFIESSDFLLGEGEAEGYEYFKYMCKLGHNSIRCLGLCQNILHALTFMDDDQYKAVVDSPFWGNFVAANSFLDNMVAMVRDDILTTKVNQSPFEETLDEFEQFFDENLRKVVNEHIRNTTGKDEFEIANAPKNVVKEHILKAGLAVLALGFYIRQRDFYQGVDTDRALQDRCSRSFWKMMEAVAAIDEIGDESHGNEFFRSNFNHVKRISEKFEFVHAFLSEDSMASDQDTKLSETTEESKTEDIESSEGTSPSKLKQGSQIKNNNWHAWIDSIEQDLTSIMSDDSMQTLKDKVKAENSSPFLKKLSKGPWFSLANKIRDAMSQADSMREENEKLKEKTKEQNIAFLKVKKSNEEFEIIKDNLERQAAELRLENQKLGPLMSDKKRLDDKLQYLQGELGNKERIISTQKDKIDKLAAEKAEVEKKASEAAAASSKPSKSRKLMMGKLLGKAADSDKGDTIMDDATLLLLDELQEENLTLKRSKLFERMQTLSASSKSFNKFMKDRSQAQEPTRGTVKSTIKLTDEESAGIHNSINEINGIKRNVKFSMCKAQVFRVGGKQEEPVSHSEEYIKSCIKHRQNNIKALNKAKAHLSRVNQILFGGTPEAELSTCFQRFLDESCTEKIEKSSEWKVIGRVRIKPPNSQPNEGKERVEKVYLDQLSAHKILKVLPTLPSLC